MEETLRAMLRDAGMTSELPAFLDVWTVFKSFAAISLDGVEDDADGLLFEWATHEADADNPERFSLYLKRQFDIPVDHKGTTHMEQLWCVFSYKSSDETRKVGPSGVAGPSSWYFRSATRYTLDEWVRDVETSPAFAFASGSDARLVEFGIVQDRMD